MTELIFGVTTISFCCENCTRVKVRLSLLVRIALPYKTADSGLSAGVLRCLDSIEYGAKASGAFLPLR
jgi:hypothetical protein